MVVADSVARSPSRLYSRDGKTLLLWRRLEYDFLACFCALLPTFRFSFFFSFLFISCIPVCFIFFVSLRLCSSHLLLSASTYFILHVISARVICTLPHLGILLVFIRLVFFFVAFFCRVAFVFCCALLPATLARDLPTSTLIL